MAHGIDSHQYIDDFQFLLRVWRMRIHQSGIDTAMCYGCCIGLGLLVSVQMACRLILQRLVPSSLVYTATTRDTLNMAQGTDITIR
jgi:hypothetical protein